jgi:hypothetical protein
MLTGIAIGFVGGFLIFLVIGMDGEQFRRMWNRHTRNGRKPLPPQMVIGGRTYKAQRRISRSYYHDN